MNTSMMIAWSVFSLSVIGLRPNGRQDTNSQSTFLIREKEHLRDYTN